MLGEALRLIRVFHDKKLVELAKELNTSPSYLSEIENQKKIPSIELLAKYAEVFETAPSALMYFSEQLDDKNKSGKIKTSIRSHLLKFLHAVENGTKGP